MSIDLKKENNMPIFYILSFILLLAGGFQLGFDKWPELSEAVIAGTVSVVLSAVLLMLTNLLPHNIKHKLVFLRFVNELPACRCHKLSKKDARIDDLLASKKWPEIFDPITAHSRRNSLWYNEIYHPVKDTVEVQQAHRNFLLYRDVFSGLVALSLIALVWRFVGDPSLIGELQNSVFVVFGIGLGFSLIAANNNGKRFVTNAISVALHQK